MKQMNHRFEHWYKLTHWMSPELDKRDDDHYENEVVQAMYIAYRAGYNKSTKDRKKEVKEQHMTTLREAAQQALEALKRNHYAMIDAGLLDQDRLNKNFTAHEALRAALAEPVQEPVAWRAVGGSIWGHKGSEDDTPLYEHPPQRKPLTIERLRDALVASRIIPPAAVEDPDEYDDGVTLFRIEALHRRIT